MVFCCDSEGHVDDKMSYYMTKMVQVRDRRLGYLYTILKLVTIAYMAFSVFLVNKQHLAYEAVHGSVRMDLLSVEGIIGRLGPFPYCPATQPTFQKQAMKDVPTHELAHIFQSSPTAITEEAGELRAGHEQGRSHHAHGRSLWTAEDALMPSPTPKPDPESNPVVNPAAAYDDNSVLYAKELERIRRSITPEERRMMEAKHAESEVHEAHALHKTMHHIECLYMDNHDLVFPPHEEGAIFVTTAMLELEQQRACAETTEEGASAKGKKQSAQVSAEMSDEEKERCDEGYWHPHKYRDNYAVGAEFFNISIGHTIDTAFATKSAIHMDGKLISHDGTVMKDMPAGRLYTLQLTDLLAAAGTSLDEAAPSEPPRFNFTRRDVGVELALIIEYSNTKGSFIFPRATPTYTIRVRAMDGHDFYVDEVAYAHWDEERIVRHRTGLRIKAFQKGRLGEFQWLAMFMSFAAAGAMISTAKTVVDMLALHVLKDKERYRSYVFEKTELGEVATKRDERHDVLKKKVLGRMMRKQISRTSASSMSVPSAPNTPYQQLLEEGQAGAVNSWLAKVPALTKRKSLLESEVVQTWAATTIQSGWRSMKERAMVREQKRLRQEQRRQQQQAGGGGFKIKMPWDKD